MRGKPNHLILFVLLLSFALTSTVQADLVGWWKLDDGTGTTAADASGGGNDGTLTGDPQWVAGKVGGALECDGGDYVDVPGAANINPENITLMTWVNFSTVDSAAMERQDFLSRGDDYAFSLHEWAADGKIWAIVTSAGGWSVLAGQTVVEADRWYHCALTYDSTTQMLTLYLDGEFEGELSVPAGLEHRLGGSLTIGTYSGRDLLGKIDDVKLFDHAMSQGEIKGEITGEGFPYAYGPDPADGALNESTWATLSWRAGDFAVSHDVYLSDNFDDVDNGTGDAPRGNQ
ncbi:MAG: LamG domain-containing protein, partial [Planctomycetota bacterium]